MTRGAFRAFHLFIWLAFAAVAGVLMPHAVRAGDCANGAATAESLQGGVETRVGDTSAWRPVELGDMFCPGDMVRTLENSRASLRLNNNTLLRLDQRATITFPGGAGDDVSRLNVLGGVGHFISRVKRRFEVVTPFVNAAVDGTEFVVDVGAEQGRVLVFEGQVTMANAEGEVVLTTGQAAAARRGEAPVAKVIARPREAVQWALYYPLVVDVAKAPSGERSDGLQQAYERSIALSAEGNAAAAIAALPEVVGDAGVLSYRASLYLTVGRVAEARTDLARALDLEPQYGRAIALQSLIAVVSNQAADGLVLAESAILSAPLRADGYLALSYAKQAFFDIPGAMAAVEEAVAVEPDNALVWARLAELRLSSGQLKLALKAAQRAVTLNPRLARTQSVLGFAHLTRTQIGNAEQAFERAIALDSADPLARLGLGLAKVRRGDLAEGRAEIELAASLDPNHALIRSYLGKAYYEEKRNAVAATQLDMAKALDPLDPTPWFYDAIRKQTENRPVDAVRDLQHSITLNDNRAVYRSRLLVDGDEAARNASLARVYKDLDFDRLALNEGWTSVNTDPGNHSAHRFLADSYSALSRHEGARISELLQAQLLQPLTPSPVQPQLAESDLLILEGAGPNAATFNEYTSLFNRDGVAFQATGVAGSNETWGDELVLSGVEGKFAYSVGQFHYETDGFRDNNDLQHDIYNVFGQVALTPQLSLQAEYRNRETEAGDIDLRSGTEIFDSTLRQDIERETGRIGVHYRPTVRSHFLVSAVYRDEEEQESRVPVEEDLSDVVLPPPLDFVDFTGASYLVDQFRGNEGESYNVELQYIGLSDTFDVVIGAGYFDEDVVDVDVSTETLSVSESFNWPVGLDPVDILGLPLNTPVVETDVEDRNAEYSNAYLYSNISPSEIFTFTLGVSFDSLDNIAVQLDELSPKVGMAWRPGPFTVLRVAWFESINKPYNQTVEPTQVAGFNQLFDETIGSKSERLGVALQQRLSSALVAGAEATWREIEQPRFGAVSTPNEVDEQMHRMFVYWAASRRFAMSAEYIYEHLEQSQNSPERLKTERLPVALDYFHPSGFFSSVTVTGVDQEVTTNDTFARANEDDFWVVDASIGLRLPKRHGRVSLTVNNAFDQDFDYRDDNFAAGDPHLPEYLPVRTVFGHLELSF